MSTDRNGTGAKLPVIRVLRSQKTRRYFAWDGWSDDPDEAKNFEYGIDAVQDCVSNHLEEIDLVLRVRGGQTDLFCIALR
jgi:hypothetical protein